jgi:hypothetical protein
MRGSGRWLPENESPPRLASRRLIDAASEKSDRYMPLNNWLFLEFQKLRLPNSRIIVHDCRLAETMTCPPPKNPWK